MLKILQVIGIFDKLKKKEESIRYYKRILKEHKEAEADALINLGVLSLEEENFDEALKYLKQALRVYGELEDEEGEAFVSDYIGDVFLNMRRMDEALDYYKDAYRIYSSIRSSAKNEMFEKIKEAEKIMEAFEVAEKKRKEEFPPQVPVEEDYVPDYEKLSEKLQDVLKILESASAYEGYFKEENPIEYFREAFVISREIGDKKGEATLLLMMGTVSLKNENLSKAFKNFKDAYDIFQSSQDKKGEAVSLLFVGTLFFIQGDMGKVSATFRKSVETFQQLKDKYSESVAIDLLNALYSG